MLLEQGCSACWLASQIPCERSNIYHIFKRRDISMELLYTISVILNHDFFAELSDELNMRMAERHEDDGFQTT